MGIGHGDLGNGSVSPEAATPAVEAGVAEQLSPRLTASGRRDHGPAVYRPVILGPQLSLAPPARGRSTDCRLRDQCAPRRPERTFPRFTSARGSGSEPPAYRSSSAATYTLCKRATRRGRFRRAILRACGSAHPGREEGTRLEAQGRELDRRRLVDLVTRPQAAPPTPPTEAAARTHAVTNRLCACSSVQVHSHAEQRTRPLGDGRFSATPVDG